MRIDTMDICTSHLGLASKNTEFSDTVDVNFATEVRWSLACGCNSVTSKYVLV